MAQIDEQVRKHQAKALVAMELELYSSKKRMRDAEEAHGVRLNAEIAKGWRRGYHEGREAGLEYIRSQEDEAEMRDSMRRNHPIHKMHKTNVMEQQPQQQPQLADMYDWS